jgi:tetratricopeptide (TPR) repeat protein
VQLLDGLGRSYDAARVRDKRGGVLYTAAQCDAALPVLEEAAEAYRRAEDVDSLGRTLAQIGHAYAWRGTREAGLSRLQPVLEPLAAGGPSKGLAALYVALAHLFFVSGRYSEQLAVSEQAVELARALEDDRTLTYAQGRRGLALQKLGRLREALPVCEETIRLAERGGDRENLARALGNVASCYAYMGEFDGSGQYRERALTVAEQYGDRTQLAFWTAMRGKVAILRGHWREARADVARARAVIREMGTSWIAAYPLIHQGELSLREGAWDEASQYLDEALRLLAHGQDLQARRFVQRVLAERDVLEGCPDAALARLAPLLDRPGLEEVDVTELLPLVAWAHLERGDVMQARAVVAQALKRAQAQHCGRVVPDGLWVQAMVAIRQEQWAEAVRALEEGLALAQSMPYPYAEGRLLHVYGEMHAQKGEPGPARERLEAALAIFRRLGARKDAEGVEQALTALQQ